MHCLIMKNLLALFISVVALTSPCIFATAKSDGKASRKVIIMDNNKDYIQRSLLPTIEATLDYDMQYVEFVFNKSVGNVNITIINDMGQTIGGTIFNTSLESIKYISVPINSGGYTILISGNDYEAEGYYNIVDYSSEF